MQNTFKHIIYTHISTIPRDDIITRSVHNQATCSQHRRSSKPHMIHSPMSYAISHITHIQNLHITHGHMYHSARHTICYTICHTITSYMQCHAILLLSTTLYIRPIYVCYAIYIYTYMMTLTS